MDATGERRIWEELKAIRAELEYIKAHMVDADTILTPGEEALLEVAFTEFEACKAAKLEDAFSLNSTERGVDKSISQIIVSCQHFEDLPGLFKLAIVCSQTNHTPSQKP